MRAHTPLNPPATSADNTLLTPSLRASSIAALLALAGCTNTGSLLVANKTESTVPRVVVTITSSGDRIQTSEIGQLAADEQRSVTYRIDSEYRLDVEVKYQDGTVKRIPYGYVIDSWRNPTHRIALEADYSVMARSSRSDPK